MRRKDRELNSCNTQASSRANAKPRKWVTLPALWLATAILLVPETAFGAPTWERKTPATAPPGRAGTNLVWDDARGQVVMFGGTGSSGVPLGDTWVWDGSTWTEKTPLVSPPRSA